MQRFIVGRALQAIVSLLAVSVIVFFIARLTGDPLDVMMDEYATAEDRAILAHQLGLDRPLPVQYFIFLGGAVQGDFGESIRAKRPALEVVLERFPATLQLGFASILWSVLIAIPIGVYSARRRGTLFDLGGRMFAVLGQAMPIFWLGLILIYIFAVWLRLLPSGGRGGWENLILPSVTMGWYLAAGIMRLTRSAMLDVLDSEYIKLARAKGLADFKVIWKHAFKNALAPVLTFSVLLFVIILGGAVVTETVFGWPGVGRLVIDAVRWRDFPVVQTVVILLASMYIVANLLVDILYAYINPKIRYQK